MQQPWCLGGKCPRVLGLKKIANSTQIFLLPCDVVVVLLHKLLSSIRCHCHTKFGIKLNYGIKLPLFSKIKLNSSFSERGKKISFISFRFYGMHKSRLYSLSVSTVLDSLLDTSSSASTKL